MYCNTSANQVYPEQVIGPNVPTVRSVVNGMTQAVTFSTGLYPFTQYNCYVTANTSAGEGAPSQVVMIESGKPCLHAYFYTKHLNMRLAYQGLNMLDRLGLRLILLLLLIKIIHNPSYTLLIGRGKHMRLKSQPGMRMGRTLFVFKNRIVL